MTNEFKATKAIQARGQVAEVYLKFKFDEDGARSVTVFPVDGGRLRGHPSFPSLHAAAKFLTVKGFAVQTEVMPARESSATFANLNAFDIEELCAMVLDFEDIRYALTVEHLLQEALDSFEPQHQPDVDGILATLARGVEKAKAAQAATV